MKVQVTKEDIASGVPNHRYDCPLAKAIKRATGKRIEVWNTRYFIDGIDYPLPPTAIEFIYNFDTGVVVQPFEFEIP